MKFVESAHLELKEIINSDFKKEIIAFANTDGGEIYIGVSNSGEIIGVVNPEEEMERISNMIRDAIRPDLAGYTSVETVEEGGGKTLIKVTVLRGQNRPYHLSDKGLKPSGVFIRHGVVSAPASEEAIRQMIKESDGTVFDKARSVNQDLTFDYAAKYFSDNNVKFEYENKRSLNLINAGGYYTNAALLLSDQCEHSIKCAVYDGNNKLQYKARKEFFGSILRQLDDAYNYISLSNNLRSKFEGLKRIDSIDYPEHALREALLNAIIHRDYDYSGSILVNIFTNRIEFVSIGGLVKGITLKDIMHGVSQPRNQILANIFYRLELIESYGTGIQRIMDSYEYCPEKPKFDLGPASFVVSLPNRNEYYAMAAADYSMTNEENVMYLLKEKEVITRKDIETYLNCSSFPAINIINDLLDKGKITKIGSARATKYVLRDK